MGSVNQFPNQSAPLRARQLPKRLLPASLLALGVVLLESLPVHAGSASASFRVSARVIKSCKISPAEIAAQEAGGTMPVSCQNQTAAAGRSGGSDGAGGTLTGATANVSYSVDEVTNSDGVVKLVTVNF